MTPSGAAAARVRIAYVVLLILLAIAPWLGVYPIFVMKFLCFALFACALNLLLGYTGLLSFGHAALFGMAAYVCGWVTTALHWPPLAGLLAGMVTSALIGLVMGAVSIRRQGIYFAMITLAMAQIVFFFCLQARFTGGEDGLQGVPRGTLLGVLPLNGNVMYYFVAAVFVLAYLAIMRIVHSPFGQVLKMIRENEPRAISLGYRVDRYKLLAFVLSAALSGLAGSMKTLVMGFATLSDVHWSMSGEVILMTLVGGVGTFFGPVLGAGIVGTVQDQLADKVGSWVTVIIGAIFVLCVLAFRRGIVGEILAFLDRRRDAKAATPPNQGDNGTGRAAAAPSAE
ncbi:MAG: branched-chain amino acid ABC transporter permease [Proteobacteria bacterium]|nr:branched-chain amino acid ABC transporter permease [Pseudomonadota bacterium]